MSNQVIQLFRKGGFPMSNEQNRATARGIVEGISRGDLSVIDNLIAEDFQEHSLPPGSAPGKEGLKDVLTRVRKTFPDFSYTIEDEIAEGDTVVHRLTGRGTMQGEFQGMPPNGKEAAWQEIHIARYKDGKAVEHWAVIDQLGMMQQLNLAGYGIGG
jgi:predicted ester cyclase